MHHFQQDRPLIPGEVAVDTPCLQAGHLPMCVYMTVTACCDDHGPMVTDDHRHIIIYSHIHIYLAGDFRLSVAFCINPFFLYLCMSTIETYFFTCEFGQQSNNQSFDYIFNKRKANNVIHFVHSERRVQPNQCYFTVDITGNKFECSL